MSTFVEDLRYLLKKYKKKTRFFYCCILKLKNLHYDLK